jgi:hypothetical protein
LKFATIALATISLFTCEIGHGNQIEVAALQANLPLLSTATYYLQDAKADEYLINFSLLSEEEIANIVSVFASALNQD